MWRTSPASECTRCLFFLKKKTLSPARFLSLSGWCGSSTLPCGLLLPIKHQAAKDLEIPTSKTGYSLPVHPVGLYSRTVLRVLSSDKQRTAMGAILTVPEILATAENVETVSVELWVCCVVVPF